MPRRLLVGPLPIGALALLVLNDRVLKAHYPSWWTGKLSDAAGLILLPIVGCAALAWVRQAAGSTDPAGPHDATTVCAVVAISFTMIKLWPPLTDVAEVLNGWFGWPIDLTSDLLAGRSPHGPSRRWIVTDPTDVLAVPFVAVAHAHIEHARRSRSGGQPNGRRTGTEEVAREVEPQAG